MKNSILVGFVFLKPHNIKNINFLISMIFLPHSQFNSPIEKSWQGKPPHNKSWSGISKGLI